MIFALQLITFMFLGILCFKNESVNFTGLSDGSMAPKKINESIRTERILLTYTLKSTHYTDYCSW